MVTNTKETPTLPPLPESTQTLVDQLHSGKFLGASRNIRMINDLFCAIVEGWDSNDQFELIGTLRATGDYFIVTRGLNTPCIGNAIRLVLKGLEGEGSPTVESVRKFILTRRAEYNAQSIRNAERMAEFGANLIHDMRVVLPFDYSSTVIAVLKKTAEKGHKLRLIVAESRVLDGGRPIAREATAMGHSVIFCVDMAISHFMRQVDVVLFGAESFLANGDCWNTVGSYSVAELARLFKVPVYVATELIKVDPLSFGGTQKSIKPVEYARIFDYPNSFENPELVSTIAPDLDNIPHTLISGYITPVGVLLPEHLRGEALQFLESIGPSAP